MTQCLFWRNPQWLGRRGRGNTDPTKRNWRREGGGRVEQHLEMRMWPGWEGRREIGIKAGWTLEGRRVVLVGAGVG